MITKCYFLRKTHSTEQTQFTRVFPSVTHFTVELTEAMQIKCIAQQHNIPMDVTTNVTIALPGERIICQIHGLGEGKEEGDSKTGRK